MKLLAAIFLLFSVPALAEPPPGVDLSSPTARWFHTLTDENGKSCCGLGDCRAVESDWREGHWWVWVKPSYLVDPAKPSYIIEPPQAAPDVSRAGKSLVKVPDEIVQRRDDNPTGHSILCASPVQPETIMYCFIPDVGI